MEFSHNHLSEFIDIGPRTSLYTPAHPEKGQLIVICTWLGAKRKHIAKFTNLYQIVAPNSRILLIQSAIPILISSYPYQRKVIQPAVSAVLDTLSECETWSPPSGNANTEISASKVPERQPKILLHTFSNGGTNSATQMLIVLREQLQKPLPLIGILCDSCPEEVTYWKSYEAMLFSLPKDTMSQILGRFACHFILVVLYTGIAFGNENPATLMRRTVLDTETVAPGWRPIIGNADNASAGRMCYLFSKEDPMCHWEDIVGHAEVARSKGWQTQEVTFAGSGHCAHLPKDEAKYSDAVKSIWEGTGVWENYLTSKS